MGLSVALSNALSGMNVGQRALDVLSRNVSNAGTPGYHRQSISVIDKLGSSPYAQAGTLTRAFSSSLQAHYTRSVADSSYADAVASMLDRLQTALGKPGDPGSLDTAFGDFETTLSSLATSPDNFATRAEVIAAAQNIASTLNRLSTDIQNLRTDADAEIGISAGNLNRALSGLEELNLRLADESADPASRAALMDQRDRLISDVASEIDINVDYRANGTVSIMTRGGIGILDSRAATFNYESGGRLSAGSLYDRDPSKNGVGSLTLTSSAGLKVDIVGENVLQSGRLSALVKLRDDTLVRAQGQLDDIAAALAQSLSTIEAAGTAVTSGSGAAGFEVDIASIRPGNDIVLDYTLNGQPRQVRVVRVEDPSQLPMDLTDANGTRVVGLSFAGGASSVASALDTLLGPGLAVSNPAGSTLRVLDDGAAGTTDVTSMTARSTVSGTQNSGLALSLFVDSGNTDFTDAIAESDQRQGFAARIAINSAIRVDNRLLVQYASGGAMGDASRAEYLRDRLDDARFVSGVSSDAIDGNFRLSGTTSEMITQALNYQGNAAATADSMKENRDLAMEALTQRMTAEYGVDVDDEMARLMELQNAFAANARIVSAVQELINTLLEI